MPIPDDLMRLIKVCEWLDCEPGVIRRWIRDGKVSKWKISGMVYLSRGDIAAMFTHSRSKQTQPKRTRNRSQWDAYARRTLGRAI